MVWVGFATYTDVSSHAYSGGYLESHAESHVEIHAEKNVEREASDANDASSA